MNNFLGGWECPGYALGGGILVFSWEELLCYSVLVSRCVVETLSPPASVECGRASEFVTSASRSAQVALNGNILYYRYCVSCPLAPQQSPPGLVYF